MPAERLQKLLARAGYGGRRTAERLIEAGSVTVDGQVAKLGQRADPELETIKVNGTPLPPPLPAVTIMLNKPEGYLVTAKDERGRKTVYDLLSDAPKSLRYVGRLDRDSGGLLLLSTDGELAFRLSHPRYRVTKRYEATVNGTPSRSAIDELCHGVVLEDGQTAPAKVTIITPGGETSLLSIAIHEGKKRQIRRMMRAVDHSVTRLTRVDFGGIQLGDLAPGQSRPLTSEEERTLRELVGLVDASPAASL